MGNTCGIFNQQNASRKGKNLLLNKFLKNLKSHRKAGKGTKMNVTGK